MPKIEVTRTVIGVRCSHCKLPGLLDQRPGHLCAACGNVLKEFRHDNTNCPWCTDQSICLACAREVRRIP